MQPLHHHRLVREGPVAHRPAVPGFGAERGNYGELHERRLPLLHDDSGSCLFGIAHVALRHEAGHKMCVLTHYSCQDSSIHTVAQESHQQSERWSPAEL